MKDKSFSVLDWWGKNGPSYPMLSGVVKQVLRVPATSTPSERVNLAGNIVTKKRSLLLPENVDKMIFLNINKAYLNNLS